VDYKAIFITCTLYSEETLLAKKLYNIVSNENLKKDNGNNSNLIGPLLLYE